MAEHKTALAVLSQAFQAEIQRMNRYLHYSFTIIGQNRIRIKRWFQEQAKESSAQAMALAEKITDLGGALPMVTAQVGGTPFRNVDQLIRECLTFEAESLALYGRLFKAAEEDSTLKNIANQFIRAETDHYRETLELFETELSGLMPEWVAWPID